MKAMVLYNSRFGSTERIARSIEIGLKSIADMQTICKNTGDVIVDSLKDYDILCIGAPTENMSAPKTMKEFLANIKDLELSGKYGFAFDTKLDSRFSGSAAKYIEKELNNLGLKIIASRESALVSSIKERGAMVGSKLKEGEEKRFQEVGRLIGTAIVQTRSEIN